MFDTSGLCVNISTLSVRYTYLKLMHPDTTVLSTPFMSTLLGYILETSVYNAVDFNSSKNYIVRNYQTLLLTLQFFVTLYGTPLLQSDFQVHIFVKHSVMLVFSRRLCEVNTKTYIAKLLNYVL